MKYPLIL
jgi:hypothetical protein